MINLPKWQITNLKPSIYDSESATAIEMVAKLYGAMQELIKEYNTTISTMQNELNKFENDITLNFEDFKNCMIKTTNDFIDAANMIHAQQQKELDEAITMLLQDVSNTASNIITQAVNEGKIVVNLDYDEVTKTLTLGATSWKSEV